jgi:hypothetical protein
MKNVRGFATALTGAAVVFGAGTMLLTPGARAQETEKHTYNAAAVARGLEIAPVTLDFGNRDRDQVGYGSYLVNAVGGCNDCHTNPSYTPDGDPFAGHPKKVNTAGYMAGGTAFGPFISRNLTPSGEGPVTGSLANFMTVFKTGKDLKALHPEISELLQVMPWTVYQDMLDADLEAMFAYLSSIPCVEGGPGEKADRCAPAATTTAVAEPKNATVQAFQINLDGTKSSSANGQPLQYRWTTVQGSPSAAIMFGDTPNPIVQFGVRGPVEYKFQLTVTDSTGKTASDIVTINYVGR